VPPLFNRYLARTGIAGQQSKEPIPADRPNNLCPPVPGPFAAHGSFYRAAWIVSPEFWAAKVPRLAVVLVDLKKGEQHEQDRR
jgi:hypothetical protein